MRIQALPDTADGIRVLRGSGELDVTVVPAMLHGLPDIVSGARAVVLDLAQVDFFDSSAVRLVDRLARECARIDAPYRVVAPTGECCHRVLDLVGLADSLAEEDLDAALTSVRRR